MDTERFANNVDDPQTINQSEDSSDNAMRAVNYSNVDTKPQIMAAISGLPLTSPSIQTVELIVNISIWIQHQSVL